MIGFVEMRIAVSRYLRNGSDSLMDELLEKERSVYDIYLS